MRRALRIILSISTIAAWLVFIYLDSLWTACLHSAVEEGKKVYGEMYGPLSVVRPLSLWIAVALSVITASWLAFMKPPNQPD